MISKSDLSQRRKRAQNFILGLNTGRQGEYKYSNVGQPILYSSCYALMSLHYLGSEISDRAGWANYILAYQQPDSGAFVSPELFSGTGGRHDREHLTLHLATTVLPCLDILGVSPRFTLDFAHRFLAPKVLAEWLGARDMRDAWLEGNNLLFLLQLLIYLRDDEAAAGAAQRLAELFAWLDRTADRNTGLWGTDGFCSNFIAMCGGYHQLLAYYSENHTLVSPNRLVDVTLELQHPDGGFHPEGGGGACEDVDAVDILVNLYKRHDYRRAEIRNALRRVAASIIHQQVDDGGFVYRRNEPFSHMGMQSTLTPANQGTVFGTWFRLHTLALIGEVLSDTALGQVHWGFNRRMSMGWHLPSRVNCPSHLGWLGEELQQAGKKKFIASLLPYPALRWLLRARQAH